MSEKFEYLTKQTAYPIIARYFESGLRPYAFYKKEGLTKSQFYLWRKQYMKDHNLCGDAGSRKATGRDARPVFHPVQMPAPMGEQPAQMLAPAHKQRESCDMNIELEYPNGVLLRLEGVVDNALLAWLIKLY